MNALHTSSLRSLPLLARGKVRDNYAVGTDRILMVASDRISAFDVIMNEPIPGKGELLTRMALFWFEKLNGIVPNHLTGDAPESVVSAEEKSQVVGRSMLVKRLKPLPVEAVVRGYLAGSGWAEYQQSQSVCGVALPSGLTNASKLPEPIFTPATKAEMGEHDENISFARMSEIDEAGTLTLMDEVLTPDSSRYWPIDGYEAALKMGSNPPSYDKQYLRDWLEAVRVDGKPWGKKAPAPALPLEVIEGTASKYREALKRLMDER
jgi:phosphoribosylaminoimidazole-succinocarboxamide synthase